MSRFVAPKQTQGQAESLSLNLSCPELIARVLIARGLQTKDEIVRLLYPPKSSIYFADRFESLQLVSDRIFKAIELSENVLVYGDYDVDGIVASIVLHSALKELEIPSNIYLPTRFGEGYGLSKQVIEQAKEQGYNLIITVDCGTTAVEELRYAREIGLDIIITDHHEPQNGKPDTLILNPLLDEKWKNEEGFSSQDVEGYYPCGAAVAFALACHLFDRAGLLSEDLADKHLELIALATIADVMKLVGINRALVAHGIDQMLDTLNIGLKALFNEFGLTSNNSPSTEQLSFSIIPALNACGRMLNPRIALKLLTTTDSSDAKQLASEIKRINSMRRDVQEKVFQEAARIAVVANDNQAHILYNPEWHPGVLGIVAAKVSELFMKPAVILSSAHGDDGTIRGSARSFGNIDIRACFQACQEHLVRFGGHKVAAGVVLEPSKLDFFSAAFNSAVSEQVKIEQTESMENVEKINLDTEATVFELSTLDPLWIWKLEPYGSGNPAPRVLVKNCLISNYKAIGRDGTTLSVTIKERNFELRTVGFRMSHLMGQISNYAFYNVFLTLHPEFFNGNRTIRFELMDIELSEGDSIT